MEWTPAAGKFQAADLTGLRDCSSSKWLGLTAEHRRAFEASTSGRYDNFCLFSCEANGDTAAAVAAVTVQPPPDAAGEDEYIVTPLFVSVERALVAEAEGAGGRDDQVIVEDDFDQLECVAEAFGGGDIGA